MGRARGAVAALAVTAAFAGIVAASASTSGATGTSGAPIPQGTQADAAYAGSGASAGVGNVFATTQRVSCFRPEVAAPFDLGPMLGYSGESPCPGATTGEDTGAAAPYATQAGSNPGYPMAAPQLVKDHSESDIRVDPTNPLHIIGTSKWFVSPEGYNHQLGFYESFNGGRSWSVQGHIPGYEGWTDDTDPVGAFDTYGNFWFFHLAYQFFYKADGSKSYVVGASQEPNRVQPAEIVGISVRPHGSKSATDWISTANGKPDIVAAYDSVGNEPDKQWITVDTTAGTYTNRIYTMWVNFHTLTPVPYMSYADARADGTHSAWSKPQALPEPKHVPQGATYLLPHVAPNGDVYTTLTNFDPAHQFGAPVTTYIDKSTDGGKTWTTLPGAVTIPVAPPLQFANTTFRDGITDSFGIGPKRDTQGQYPLYVAYEDYSAGWTNVLLTASYDGGSSWSKPVQVNDNTSHVDEFQPSLSVSPKGTVSVAWYDRRLACPTGREAVAAGLSLDPGAAAAQNYCVNSSVQFYDASLNPVGRNVRLTQHTWDPQLNAPHDGSPSDSETFIGDYFGNDATGVAGTDYLTFVSTYDDGSNPEHRQQQVVATIGTP